MAAGESEAVEQRAYVRRLRVIFGINCPECLRKNPKRTPTLLLPQQRCGLDQYLDDRPALTIEQKKQAREKQDRRNVVSDNHPQ